MDLLQQLHKYGDTVVQLRLGALALIDRLDEGKHRHRIKPDFGHTMKLVMSKTKKLIDDVAALEALFDDPPARNYAPFIKAAPVPPRLVRVGTPVVTDESDGMWAITSTSIYRLFQNEGLILNYLTLQRRKSLISRFLDGWTSKPRAYVSSLKEN